MTCKYKSSCKYYQDNSYTCNYNSGGDYCGTYRKSNGLGAKLLFIFLFLFISLGIGGVLAISFTSDNSDAVNYINSNANITINTYNQTWLEFDGVDDYVNTNIPSLNTSKPFTYVMWINRNADTDTQVILGQNFTGNDREPSFWFESGALSFRFRNATQFYSSASISNFPSNVWTQVIGTYDGNSMKIYKDGSKKATQSNVPSVINNEEDNLLIGARYNGGLPQTFFNGSVEEFIIYNRSLNEGEIIDLYTKSNRININLTIPVFMFHNINDTGICQRGSCFINTTAFNNFLIWLKNNNYSSITDVEYYNWTQNGGFIMPDKPFIIIWDDAQLSQINASEIMGMYGYKGVMALNTGFINSCSNGQPCPYNTSEMNYTFMNWTDVNNIINLYNWSVASHSDVHCWMSTYGNGGTFNISCTDSDSRKGNMSYSKQEIFDNTGINPITFIHPNNDWNLTTMSDCLLNYTLCFGGIGNFIHYNSNFSDGSLVRLIGEDYDNNESLNNRFNFTLPVDYYLILKLNENSGTTAYDVSGNGNNGTISGATWNNDGNVITTTLNILTVLTAPSNIILSPIEWIYNYLISSSVNGISNYVLLNNTDSVNSYNITITDGVSALAYNTNGSILCGGLVTGNCNITLAPNNASYVLDNFNLTEGVTRENSPFSFTVTSDTSKHINSSIVDPVAVEISFNVAQCDTLGKITYTSGQDGYNRDFFPSDYSCSDNVVTLTATLEQSSESNEFEIQYGCSSITRASYRIIMLLLSVGILFMTAMFAKKRYEEGTINIKHILIIFLIITMAIVLWSSSAQTLGNSCGVIG